MVSNSTTPRTAAWQASQSITNSQSLLKLKCWKYIKLGKTGIYL